PLSTEFSHFRDWASEASPPPALPLPAALHSVPPPIFRGSTLLDCSATKVIPTSSQLPTQDTTDVVVLPTSAALPISAPSSD
ncbi:unnamed protein product, partial [Ilex paraguariensis]